jgi:tape measure domain-containing protein
MATTLADVQIRIGTEITQFQNGLRKAERELQRSADKFNNIGNNLTVAVSAPLAAIGFGALKSAGNIEALRLGFEATMTGAGKSTAEATAELLKLQKAAEAPGLDFEQAVKGSVRLQNVGFEAEQSRKIIAQLANGIALTGGSAQELDGVTRQFAQMAGKGRILQEDLTILLENMPVLSKVLKDTFGTANADGLRKLGISTEEFILKTTEGLTKLERVPGGLNNAFTNAGVSIKLALANVGESINKAVDVTGKLEAFSTTITDLAAGFSSLGQGTQQLILGFGAAALAAGPLFKLIGGSIETYSVAKNTVKALNQAVTSSISGYRDLAPELGGLSAALRSAGAAWKALDTVAKATVIGAALGVVVALGFAFYKLSDSMSVAGKTQATLNDVIAAAQKNIVGERLEAERLIGVINSNTASYDDKLAAQKRLQDISPEFFSNLSLEATGHDKNTAALQRYTAQLLTAAKAQAAQEKIVELERERLDILQKIPAQQARALAGNVLGTGLGSALTGAANLFGSGTLTLEKRQQEIDAQIKALSGIATDASIATAKLQQQATTTVGTPLGVGAPIATGGSGTQKPVTFDGFKDVATGLVVIEDSAILVNDELSTLSTTMNLVATENSNALAVALAYTADNFYAARDAALANEEALLRVQAQMETAAAAGQAVGDAIFQASADGAASLGDLAKAGANAARQFIAQQIAMGIAAQVRSALGTGLAGLILAPIAGAAAGALFNKLIPKFAEGGIVTGPTYGLVGEAGPEVIFPLSDLKKFMGSNGGGGAVQVFGRLSGTDILLSSERSDQRRFRQRGY